MSPGAKHRYIAWSLRTKDGPLLECLWPDAAQRESVIEQVAALEAAGESGWIGIYTMEKIPDG